MPSNNFGDAFRKHAQKVANDARADSTRRLQREVDVVFNRYQGQPVETVLPHMRAAFTRAGVTPDSGAQLRRFAQSVADGNRITGSFTPVRF